MYELPYALERVEKFSSMLVRMDERTNVSWQLILCVISSDIEQPKVETYTDKGFSDEVVKKTIISRAFHAKQ